LGQQIGIHYETSVAHFMVSVRKFSISVFKI